MKFTLGELRIMKFSLQKIAEKELPIKISWKITKFLKQVNDELEMIEKERIKLVHKYGENEEGKEEIKVPNDKIEDFKKEFVDFLSSEVDINCEPINVKDLGDIELSSSDLLVLQKYITE